MPIRKQYEKGEGMEDLLRRLLKIKRTLDLMPDGYVARVEIVMTKRRVHIQQSELREMTPEEIAEQARYLLWI